ncbi:MAG: hypothetical protein ACLR7K_14960 [Subdoligranulum sp.]
MTNISQTQAGFKSKSLGILCGFQGSLTQNPAALVETDDIFGVSDTPYGFSGLNTLRAAGVPNPPPPFAQRFIARFCSQTAAASQSKSAYILSSLESPCILCSLLRNFHILSKKLQKTC